jgi:hypothetical protein
MLQQRAEYNQSGEAASRTARLLHTLVRRRVGVEASASTTHGAGRATPH